MLAAGVPCIAAVAWDTISAWPIPSVHTSLPVLKKGFGFEFILRYIPSDSSSVEAKNAAKPAIPSRPMMPDAAPARMAMKTRLHGVCARQGSAVDRPCVCVCECVYSGKAAPVVEVPRVVRNLVHREDL